MSQPDNKYKYTSASCLLCVKGGELPQCGASSVIIQPCQHQCDVPCSYSSAAPPWFSRILDKTTHLLYVLSRLFITAQSQDTIAYTEAQNIEAQNIAPQATVGISSSVEWRSPVSMSRTRRFQALPDIVRDAKLEAEISSTHTKNVFHISTPTIRQMRIEELWVRDVELGHGAYGIVHLERCEQKTKTKLRAVKQVRKMIAPGHAFDYASELEAVMKFSHPKYRHCFVRSYGWYESRECIFIAMEYLQHGDLQKHLIRPLPEHETRLITTQIVEGLRFMHENGFTHRDLKPGNIMVVDKGPQWYVKITDFGISKRRHENVTSLHTMQRGSLGFAAPEALGVIDAKGSYTSVVDMWSLGAVVYTMLTSTTPFSNLSDVFFYATGSLEFPLAALQRLSITQYGQQFIVALMAPDGRKRLSSVNADKHPWMTTPLTFITAIADDGNTIASVASASWSTIAERPIEQDLTKKEIPTTQILKKSRESSIPPAYQSPSVEECLDEPEETVRKSLPKDSLHVLDDATLIPAPNPKSSPLVNPKAPNPESSFVPEKTEVPPKNDHSDRLFGPRTRRPYFSRGGEKTDKYERLAVSDSEEPMVSKLSNSHHRSASTGEVPRESLGTSSTISSDREAVAGDHLESARFSDTTSNCSSSGRRRSFGDSTEAQPVLRFEEVKNYRAGLPVASTARWGPARIRLHDRRTTDLKCSHCPKKDPVSIGKLEYLECECWICHRCLVERFAMSLISKDFKLECCGRDIPLQAFQRILIDPEVNRLWREGYAREDDRPGPDDKFIIYLLRNRLILDKDILAQMSLITGFFYDDPEAAYRAPRPPMEYGGLEYSSRDAAAFARAAEYCKAAKYNDFHDMEYDRPRYTTSRPTDYPREGGGTGPYRPKMGYREGWERY